MSKAKKYQILRKKNGKCQASFVVQNDKGLHTRPSTEIVKCATSFKSRIHLQHKNYTVNGKSLLGILMLAAPKGAKILIEAEGIDAEKAIIALLDLAYNKFFMDY